MKLKSLLTRATLIPVGLWPKHVCDTFEFELLPDDKLKAVTMQANEDAKQLSVTTNWFGSKAYFWLKHIELCDQPIDYLEIGSWEGMSAWFFARHFPKASIHCIDTWEGSDEHGASTDTEARFDANVRPYADRITKHKGMSQHVLPSLAGREFDVIYIDGSHYADDVLLDALNCWPMLKQDGYLIFDDFLWQYDCYPKNKWANTAINAFLDHFGGEYELLYVGQQVIVQKTLAREAIVLNVA